LNVGDITTKEIGVKKAILMILVMLVCGCASKPPDVSAFSEDDFAKQVTSSTSEYDSSVIYVGPKILCYQDLYEDCFYYLGSTKNKKTGEFILHTIIVESNYSGSDWRFYDSISLPGGETRKLTDSKRSVSSGGACCSFVERSYISIGESEFNSQSIKFRLNAKQGKPLEIYVPGNLLRGYLKGVRAK
jgi:hypothetical protein